MATDYIKIYNGTVTKGETDGEEVSCGTQSNPVSFTLNSAKAESGCAKLAIRCKSGFQTYGTTTITAKHYDASSKAYNDEGDAKKWFFAADADYADAATALEKATWRNSLSIADTIGDTNTVFWVKATSSEAEVPTTDTDESICVDAVIEAM